MQTEIHQPRKQTSPFRYAFGMFGTSIPVNMFKTYAAFFYIDRLGFVTTPQFSLILFIYTFIDAIDNPIYGYLSDRTRTKWGRRRPWLVIGAPLLVLCFILFFNPPEALAKGSMFSYMLIMYLLTGTLDSLINANYGALFPELFKGEALRAKTNALRQIFQFVAMIISIALTPVVTNAIGFSATAMIYGLLAVVVIWYMALGSYEDPASMEKPKPAFFSSLKAIVLNPRFWVYGITNAAFYAALGLVQSGVPFFVKYNLGEEGLAATIMLGTVILTTILFIPVWVRIIRKTGLMPAWRAALILIGLSIIPLYFTKSLLSSTLVVVLFGFAMAGVSTTMDIVGARILDEDARKYGVQREGTFGSLLSVLNKTSGLFTSLAFLLVFRIYGFESGTNPGETPGQAAKFLTVLFPIAIMILCVTMSRFLRFDEKVPSEVEEAE